MTFSAATSQVTQTGLAYRCGRFGHYGAYKKRVSSKSWAMLIQLSKMYIFNTKYFPSFRELYRPQLCKVSTDPLLQFVVNCAILTK